MKEEAEAVMHTGKDVLENIVVVVSLVHTLTETFGSASDLYRKIKRKAGSSGSDDEDDSRRGPRRRPSHRRRDSSSDSDHDRRRRHLRWKLDARKDESSDSDEELIVTSSSQVRAEYERGYKKLGEPFARGDLMTQNQLQAQIIELQRTLLSIHQDYMLSTYLSPSSSNSHLIRLIQTTRTARIASIHALHMQYERLLLAPAPEIPDCPPTIPGAYPNPPHKIPRRDSMVHRPHSRPGHRSRSSSPHVPSEDKEYRIQPFPNPSPAPKRLFCVYARDLQDHDRLPLTDNYKADGNNLCPFCRTHIAVRPGKVWELVVDDCKGHGAKKTFLVKNRFVVKSHREGGGFACVLCAKYKPADTVCREIGSLMEHLWRDHNSEEMEKDEDIVETDE